jgi:hypothetical protein
MLSDEEKIMRLNKKLVGGFYITTVFIVALGGCSDSELNTTAARKLQALAKSYVDFAVARGVGPADQIELAKYLKESSDPLLLAVSVRPQASSFFVSDRDGQPLQVRYKIPMSEIVRKKSPLLAREPTGLDGRCLAVYANGKVVCAQEPIPKEWQSDE